eukprot:ANDGO_07370.mRNA.1 DNA polymerase eta
MHRVVALLDVDCFYAQAEQLHPKNFPLSETGAEDRSSRSGPPKRLSVPLAVVQRSFLVAVSYEARPYGVQRFDAADLGVQKCPHIILRHNRMEYYRTESERLFTVIRSALRHVWHNISTRSTRSDASESASASSSASVNGAENEDDHDLDDGDDRGFLFERASVDESYMDLTEITRLVQVNASNAVAFLEKSISAGLGRLQSQAVALPFFMTFDPVLVIRDAESANLGIASLLMKFVQLWVYEKLGYTTSVGIAANKLMAKVASGLKKPGGQTVIHSASYCSILKTEMRDVTSLHGLKGKLGRHLAKCGLSSIAALQDLEFDAFRTLYGHRVRGSDERAVDDEQLRFVWLRARGMDDSAVVARTNQKMIMLEKGYPLIKTSNDVMAVLIPLVDAMVFRLCKYYSETRKCATSLTARFRVHVHSGSYESGNVKFPSKSRKFEFFPIVSKHLGAYSKRHEDLASRPLIPEYVDSLLPQDKARISRLYPFADPIILSAYMSLLREYINDMKVDSNSDLVKNSSGNEEMFQDFDGIAGVTRVGIAVSQFSDAFSDAAHRSKVDSHSIRNFFRAAAPISSVGTPESAIVDGAPHPAVVVRHRHDGSGGDDDGDDTRSHCDVGNDGDENRVVENGDGRGAGDDDGDDNDNENGNEVEGKAHLLGSEQCDSPGVDKQIEDDHALALRLQAEWATGIPSLQVPGRAEKKSVAATSAATLGDAQRSAKRSRVSSKVLKEAPPPGVPTLQALWNPKKAVSRR